MVLEPRWLHGACVPITGPDLNHFQLCPQLWGGETGNGSRTTGQDRTGVCVCACVCVCEGNNEIMCHTTSKSFTTAFQLSTNSPVKVSFENTPTFFLCHKRTRDIQKYVDLKDVHKSVITTVLTYVYVLLLLLYLRTYMFCYYYCTYVRICSAITTVPTYVYVLLLLLYLRMYMFCYYYCTYVYVLLLLLYLRICSAITVPTYMFCYYYCTYVYVLLLLLYLRIC